MADKTVIKLNNIPHGFYEEQMKKFFSQFGKVKHVILVRSKKTLKSRGFGFVEFAYPQIAKAAAEAMHNYLFFNHVLKCRQIDKKDLPPRLLTTKKRKTTTVEENKKRQNVGRRSSRKLKQDYWKIMRIQELMKNNGIELQCHVINKPNIE